MEKIVTDAPFYDGRDAVQTAIDVVSQTGFLSETRTNWEKTNLELLFYQADGVINRPRREALYRYKRELDEWRYRVGVAGLTMGVMSGVAADLAYFVHTYGQKGDIANENYLIGGGVLFGLTTVGAVIGEVAARLIVKSRSKVK